MPEVKKYSIEIYNSLDTVDICVDTKENNKLKIYLKEKYKYKKEIKKKIVDLCKVKVGSEVEIKGNTFIILEQRESSFNPSVMLTTFITKDVVAIMPYGVSNDYYASNVRKFCQDIYLENLKEIFSPETIAFNQVNLTADNYSDIDKLYDKVKILSTFEYHKYRDILSKYNYIGQYWTCTKPSIDTKTAIKIITNLGTITTTPTSREDIGIRPVFTINTTNMKIEQ